MFNEKELQSLLELKQIAQRLNELLRDDCVHSLQLNSEYPQKQYAIKWTSEVQQKNLLAESLCKKLDTLFFQRMQKLHYKNSTVRKEHKTNKVLASHHR